MIFSPFSIPAHPPPQGGIGAGRRTRCARSRADSSSEPQAESRTANRWAAPLLPRELTGAARADTRHGLEPRRSHRPALCWLDSTLFFAMPYKMGISSAWTYKTGTLLNTRYVRTAYITNWAAAAPPAWSSPDLLHVPAHLHNLPHRRKAALEQAGARSAHPFPDWQQQPHPKRHSKIIVTVTFLWQLAQKEQRAARAAPLEGVNLLPFSPAWSDSSSSRTQTERPTPCTRCTDWNGERVKELHNSLGGDLLQAPTPPRGKPQNIKAFIHQAPPQNKKILKNGAFQGQKCISGHKKSISAVVQIYKIWKVAKFQLFFAKSRFFK